MTAPLFLRPYRGLSLSKKRTKKEKNLQFTSRKTPPKQLSRLTYRKQGVSGVFWTQWGVLIFYGVESGIRNEGMRRTRFAFLAFVLYCD